MKELSEAELEKIAYNCRKATFIIEKQQLGRITPREKLELKIHLAGCSICATFMKQSIAINQMAKKIFDSYHGELRLNERFKEQLQKRIMDHLSQNRL